MRICLLVLMTLVICASISRAETLQSQYSHPTLQYRVSLTTQTTPGDATYTISVYDIQLKTEIFRDQGTMAPMFVEAAHKKTTNHFMHDINFDGNQEFFLEFNNPLRYESYVVFVFDSGIVSKVVLDFNGIHFNKSEKTFTCRMANGIDSYLEFVQKYSNGQLETLSSREVKVTAE